MNTNKNADVTLKISQITWSFQDDIVYDNIALCLYATGCAWGCKGCQNKDLWDFESEASFEIKTGKLIEYIRDKIKYINEENISVVGLGGDFWYQADNYTKAMAEIKKEFPKIKIVWYTGAYFEYKHPDNLESIDAILWGPLKNKDEKVYKTLTNAPHTEIAKEIFVNDYDHQFEDDTEYAGEHAYA